MNIVPLQVSVLNVVSSAADNLSAHEAERAKELAHRALVKMPKVFEFITADTVERFLDLACSVHELPPVDGPVASIKDIELWFREITSDAHIMLPAEGYRICAHGLMRYIFCFSKHDLVDLDIGFYKAMMAFVRPMRDAITQHNTVMH